MAACAPRLRSRPTEIRETTADFGRGARPKQGSPPPLNTFRGRRFSDFHVSRLFVGVLSCDLLRLLVPKMPIGRALRQKLVVAIHVDDAAAIDHKDRVRIGQHRQPVRDDDDGASFGEPAADFCRMIISLSESSALVASSKIRSRGSVISARAIASRCFCPPERF